MDESHLHLGKYTKDCLSKRNMNKVSHLVSIVSNLSLAERVLLLRSTLRGYKVALPLIEQGRLRSLKLDAFAFCFSTLCPLVSVGVLPHQVSHVFYSAVTPCQCISRRATLVDIDIQFSEPEVVQVTSR
jgi:hypothetical protein